MEPKTILINVARTGGTSISQMVADALKPGTVITEYGDSVCYDVFGHVEEQHFLRYIATLSDYQIRRVKVFAGHPPLVRREKLPFPVRYVMVLREPIARLISAHTYSLGGCELAGDFYNFGLHLSSSFIGSHNYENPISKFLLRREIVTLRDLSLLEDIISDIDILGTLECFDEVCAHLFSALGKELPASIIRKNASLAVDPRSIPPQTTHVLRQRNQVDAALYRLVSTRACARPNRDEAPTGAFSSGDYHPELASDFAFDQRSPAPWFSASAITGYREEYIGFDFGPERRPAIGVVKLQAVMAPAGIEFQLEASDDFFRHDVRPIRQFAVTTSFRSSVVTVEPSTCARFWRIKRLPRHRSNPLALASIAFGDQAFGEKDRTRCQKMIDDVVRQYNKNTYQMALQRPLIQQERTAEERRRSTFRS